MEEEYQLEADTNAEESWKLFKKVVMRAAEEVCGTIKGGKHLERENWWWNEEVQESLIRKKDVFKKWQMQGGNELKEAYKNTKREAKAAVAKAKNEAYRQWYDKMGTEEGERVIYKVAKQRARSRRDIGEVNVIKDQIGEMLTDEVKIKDMWREQPTKCRKRQGTARRSTSSRRTSPRNIKGRGEESHREHEEGKSSRMLRPPDRPYQTPRGEWSGHDA